MNRLHPRTALHLALAGTLALGGLVGCAAPAGAPAPSATAPATAGTPATAGNTTAEQGAAALATEVELEDYGTMMEEVSAAPAAYALAQADRMMAGDMAKAAGPRRPVSAEVKTKMRERIRGKGRAVHAEAISQAKKAQSQVPTRDKAREEARAHLKEVHGKVRTYTREVHAKAKEAFKTHLAAVAPRLAQKSASHQALRSQASSTAYVDHGDGTKSKTLEFQEKRMLHGQSVDHKVRVVHTVSSDGDFPLSTEVSLERTWPDGRKSVAHHVKSLQADGGHRVAFHEEASFPSGVSRVAAWVKQVAVGGKVSSSGTVAMKKASGLFSRTWAVTHTAAAAAKVLDLVGGVSAKVAIGPNGDASASVTDDAAASDDSASQASVDTDGDDADATAADDVGTAMDEASSDDSAQSGDSASGFGS